MSGSEARSNRRTSENWHACHAHAGPGSAFRPSRHTHNRRSTIAPPPYLKDMPLSYRIDLLAHIKYLLVL